MTVRKTRPRKHVIADMSLHHLAYIIASCTFTVEPTRADYGYDLSVFTFDDAGADENGNFFVQLKATDRLRTDSLTGEVRFRSGGHVLFRHARTGAILSVPNVEKHVRPIYVSTAARMVQNSGMATSTAFDTKLGELARR